jgi:RNA polymerase sigma-70 factor (ECF subfamily)
VTDARVESIGGSPGASQEWLTRLKDKDPGAWELFVDLYQPLVSGWCRQFGLKSDDADEVCQDVFHAAARSIDTFFYRKEGDTLRGWLWRITRNKATDLRVERGPADRGVGGSDALEFLNQLSGRYEDSGSTVEDKESLQLRVVDMVLRGCKKETRQAFLRVVAGEERPEDVARDLGMTVNQVYLAKSRTLKQIRDAFARFIDT